MISSLDSTEVKVPLKEYYPPTEKMGVQLPYVPWREGLVIMEELLLEVQRKIPLLEQQVEKEEQEEKRLEERKEQIRQNRSRFSKILITTGMVIASPFVIGHAIGVDMDKDERGLRVMKRNLNFLKDVEIQIQRGIMRRNLSKEMESKINAAYPL